MGNKINIVFRYEAPIQEKRNMKRFAKAAEALNLNNVIDELFYDSNHGSGYGIHLKPGTHPDSESVRVILEMARYILQVFYVELDSYNCWYCDQPCPDNPSLDTDYFMWSGPNADTLSLHR